MSHRSPLILVFLLGIIRMNQAQTRIPEELAGTWQDTVSLYLPIAKEKSPSPHAEDNPVIKITIYEDGTVQGHVGPAMFHDCIVKKNRSWLGRFLNIRTDYIITHGTLQGLLTPQDQDTTKQFTLPFNLRDGQLVGSIMWTHRFRYPDPVARVRLSQVQPEAENR